MVMIETFLGMAKYLSPRNDDDWSDRMHYLYTPNILLAFSVLISWKQFGGRPMECMFPNKFPGSWEQYAENYCWSANTYFVEKDVDVELVSEEIRQSKDRQLSYYQWVPFFLLLQAAFFRAPSLLWKYFSNHSGIRIHEVVERAADPGNVEEETRTKNIDLLSRHLQKALRFQRRIQRKRVVVHKTCTCLNMQYSSGFITTIYLFTKLLYALNVVAQLLLLNHFLRTNKYDWYGIGIIRDIIGGVKWETSGFFPRISICDFEIRQMANIQKYSVQCVLVINMFNEKIFVLLWFWYAMLFASSIFSIASWFFVMVFPCFSRWFVAQHLELSALNGFNPQNKRTNQDVARFVHFYLHRDGIFVLRMLSSHAGVIFTTDLVCALYRAFYGIEECAESQDESQLEYRKNGKKREVDFEGGEFTTSLMPGTPHDDECKSIASSTSSKKD
ncbi:hypothetical protein PENTCL1PPCAC_3249 [Pristionchus entomophagus]|uniref:Innexin n=1 Tax=Pristionchus entomophagus TaxID=358040 RepID=A0AAV5SI30_9BILA|nr:hypothetical protein PENTCL1PPCAC_3249 [Pristionchus entomophagus]